MRGGTRIDAFHHGGGQERHRRAGTTNVPGAVGLGKAAELAQDRLEDRMKRESDLVERLWSGLSAAIPDIRRNGHPQLRIPNILNVCLEGVEGEAILLSLDRQGIQVSSGSACTTGSLEASHVLLAIGLAPEIAHGSVRFSLGPETVDEDIDRVIEVMTAVAERLRAMSPTWKG